MSEKITIDPTDAESLADAIRAGVTTPELLANWIDDAEVIDGCLVVAPGVWHADDGNCEISGEHDSGEDAKRRAAHITTFGR